MAKIGLFEKFYNWMETTIMDKLMAQDSPDPVFKWIFKIPVLQYKLGLEPLVRPAGGRHLRKLCPCREALSIGVVEAAQVTDVIHRPEG